MASFCDETTESLGTSEERRNNMALTGRITGKAAGYNQTSRVTISFLTDDEKELKSSINLQNETDTVKQPRRKEYKEVFKQSATDRRLYDRRNLEALDKKLKECHKLTKCPTLALTLVGNKIYYSGPAKFRQFATDSDVQPVFSSIVVDQSNNEVSDDRGEDFPRIKLSDGWRDFNVFSKQKLVIALVTNNGSRNPKWKEMIRPAWWPERIPFGDPNNSKPRLSAEQLHSIHAACSSCTLFSEDNTGVAQCDNCSEENHHDARDDDVREDVDVNNDASDDVDTINTEDYVVEDGFRHDCVGVHGQKFRTSAPRMR